jgi:hypothetical protein
MTTKAISDLAASLARPTRLGSLDEQAISDLAASLARPTRLGSLDERSTTHPPFLQPPSSTRLSLSPSFLAYQSLRHAFQRYRLTFQRFASRSLLDWSTRRWKD